MKRTFIAIKIPVNDKILTFYNLLKSKLIDDDIKWVETGNMHITLFFLGDTESKLIPEIENRLSEISQKNMKNTLEIKGAGTYKKGRFPRVIWLGTVITEQLIQLQKEIAEMLSEYGFESDKDMYTPHLTLGRIKYISNPQALSALIEEHSATVFNKFTITSFIFYESELTPKGPRYIVIKEFLLQ